MKEDLLERLAALCGLEPAYYDIWGHLHHCSSETKLSLLGAMGISVEGDQAMEAAVVERETRPWRRLTAPVLVVDAGRTPVQVSLRFPATRPARRFEWTVTWEDGRREDGLASTDQLGVTRRREVDGVDCVEALLDIPLTLEPGYHELSVRESDTDPPLAGRTSLITAPARCYTPDGLEGEGRVWGPAAQLYALRSRRNWGMGDFTDLKRLTEWCAEAGAGIVGCNPLHGLFPGNPEHASPYSPSTRLFLNTLYLDCEVIADLHECEEARRAVEEPRFRARLAALRDTDLVDYSGVAAIKRPVLELLWRHFREFHLDRETDRARAFRGFQAEGGRNLELHGLFEALQEHFRLQDASLWGWPVWPEEYRTPHSGAVARFGEEHRDRVEFFQYLQWQADIQLSAVGRRSMELGLKVGLYQDLPVSVDGAGMESWAHQDLYALGARIGAPPDDFNLEGQDWGLPPFIPERLQEMAYGPFISLLRQNMRHGGALRIDHVMGLMRLFWVPPGKKPREGAYVRYPFRDLLGILALESLRNRCMVIGEDLGTVPDEVRQALAPLGVLSYRVAYFEKDDRGNFKPPGEYPPQALVAVSTHDLPTLAGYWQGRDLAVRTELGLFPSDELREAQIVGRAQDRARLLLALEREGLLPEGIAADSPSMPEMSEDLVKSIHLYMARTPCKVFMIQLEDVLGQVEQVNMPGTTDEYPNWRRKLSMDLDSLESTSLPRDVAAALRRERGEGRMRPSRWVAAGKIFRMARIPNATYRLQLNKDFGFAQAAALVPYLSALRISHCYVSPFLKARPGSSHGYDITDHGALNPELGTMQDFQNFVNALHQYGMGQILDVVPNHMGIGSDNRWWMDVLENGQASAHAGFFDINWRPFQDELRDKVLLPVLEDHYGSVLEAGLLRLDFDDVSGGFSIIYHEHRFPVDPAGYASILSFNLEGLAARMKEDENGLLEFQSLIGAFGNLPSHRETAEERVRARIRDKEVHRRQLARLCAERPAIKGFIQENVVLFNGEAGRPESFDLLHELLESQPYRLAFWRVASDDINYRRFFDINDLAALRMENRPVFEATHRFVLEMISQGSIDGLRIDHPDGLYSPGQYYEWLQDEVGMAVDHLGAGLDSRKRSRGRERRDAVYVVVEKILAAHERLPDEWPVHGTTGYDFSQLIGGLLVDGRAEAEMDKIYSRFLGRRLDCDELLHDSKKLIMQVALASELNVLALQLNRISESDRHSRDFTLNKIREALGEVVACFPVYRTYFTGDRIRSEDRSHVEWAVAQARKRSRAADTSIYDFIHDVLFLDPGVEKTDAYRRAVTDFAMKFQQYTGPVMAKGLEDTCFYIYNRLLSLNEVGADPRRFGVSVSGFHHMNGERARRWPFAMLNTSTHDSKRSEDVRARIHVLSEMGRDWKERVNRWALLNRSKGQSIEAGRAPSRNDEYALYQTLIGAWPFGNLDAQGFDAFRDRIEAAMIKTVREAKAHSSWINPNREYEEAVSGFIRALLNPATDNRFLEEFLPFQRRVARFGMFNSLSQTLLKLTVPGVPDIYQGTEVWRLALVDPDNRRPVDYGRRRRLLDELQARVSGSDNDLISLARELTANMEDGRIKLYVTWRTLEFRSENPDCFWFGTYLPLQARGAAAEHLCAFARQYGGSEVLVAAPRLYSLLCEANSVSKPLGPVWGDTVIDLSGCPVRRQYRNVFTGETLAAVSNAQSEVSLPAAQIFRNFPLALLTPA